MIAGRCAACSASAATDARLSGDLSVEALAESEVPARRDEVGSRDRQGAGPAANPVGSETTRWAACAYGTRMTVIPPRLRTSPVTPSRSHEGLPPLR